jgi:hypothetical protein
MLSSDMTELGLATNRRYSAMTPAQRYVLLIMADEDEELVCEREQCWVGDHRTSWQVVRWLLRVLAIKDVSDTKGLTRYAINETGRALLRRPELEWEIFRAVLKKQSFTISKDRIVELTG